MDKKIQTKKIQTFEEFWPFYLGEHRNPLNRKMHFIGTALTFVIIALAWGLSDARVLISLPFVGYGFAWVGHFIVEKNRPATFTYPLWSLAADYKMFFMTLLGRMPTELQKAGVSQN